MESKMPSQNQTLIERIVRMREPSGQSEDPQSETSSSLGEASTISPLPEADLAGEQHVSQTLGEQSSRNPSLPSGAAANSSRTPKNSRKQTKEKPLVHKTGVKRHYEIDSSLDVILQVASLAYRKDATYGDIILALVSEGFLSKHPNLVGLLEDRVSFLQE